MPEASRHPAIVAFLSQVDERLRRLPTERRAAERAELALHLDLLVTAQRARGLDEDEAARDAIRRFGPAERIGSQLDRAWHRGQRNFRYGRWFGLFTAFVAFPYLGYCWSTEDGVSTSNVVFVLYNGLAAPVLHYATEWWQRRTAARIGEEEHA